MYEQRGSGRLGVPQWVVLLIAIAALVVGTAALTATLVGSSPLSDGFGGGFGGMMGGNGSGGMMGGGMMGGDGSGGMMGGYAAGRGPGLANGPQPGDAGFAAGTKASPRVVRLLAGPALTFTPSVVAVARGETVTFEVTTMGPAVHEFMVGPADAVAADRVGTPEIADIWMMATKSLTYTFDGPGPYAFGCHVDGHFEAGMRGLIVLWP